MGEVGRAGLNKIIFWAADTVDSQNKETSPFPQKKYFHDREILFCLLKCVNKEKRHTGEFTFFLRFSVILTKI